MVLLKGQPFSTTPIKRRQARLRLHFPHPLLPVPGSRPCALHDETDGKGSHEQVRALVAKGMRYTEIARYLGMHRETVATFARAETFPERTPSPTRPHLLDPYKPYLLRRWNEGCFNATQLAQEIAAQGYTGATSKVIAYLVPLRKAQRAARHAGNRPDSHQ